MEYVDLDINDQWTSFKEYTRGDWDGFMGCLKSEYPKITTEEQGSMDQLRQLCQETPEISLAEEKCLLDFKWKFFFIVQKCLKPLAITGNRELVEYFMQCLDANFRKALNSRLSLQGHLRVDVLGRSHIEDPYALDQVIQKAVDLVSSKTIARALQHSAMLGLSAGKLDPNLRAPMLFMKQETTRKVELSLDLESLQMDMNVLKTMYEKQEKEQEKHEKHIQSLIESIHTSVSRSGYQKEFLSPTNQNQYQNQNRYAGPLGPVPPRSSRKCYYCFGTDHLFLNCMVKNDKKAVNARGFPVFFLNRSFPNYCLSSGEDKSLNKDKMYDLLRKAL